MAKGSILLRQGNQTCAICVPSEWSIGDIIENASIRFPPEPWTMWQIVDKIRCHVDPRCVHVTLNIQEIPRSNHA